MLCFTHSKRLSGANWALQLYESYWWLIYLFEYKCNRIDWFRDKRFWRVLKTHVLSCLVSSRNISIASDISHDWISVAKRFQRQFHSSTSLFGSQTPQKSSAINATKSPEPFLRKKKKTNSNWIKFTISIDCKTIISR